MKITLVSGPVDSGKTRYLKDLADREAAGGGLARGVLSVKSFEEEELARRFIGYDLLRLDRGTSEPLARLSLPFGQCPPGWFAFRKFCFNRAAIEDFFSYAEQRHRGESRPACKVSWIIDEIGPLEREGKGFSDSLSLLLKRPEGIQNLYLSVRPSLVEDIQERFGFSCDSLVTL